MKRLSDQSAFIGTATDQASYWEQDVFLASGSGPEKRLIRAQNPQVYPFRNNPEKAFCFFNPMEVAYGLRTAQCVVVV